MKQKSINKPEFEKVSNSEKFPRKMASSQMPEELSGTNIVRDTSILTGGLQSGCVCGVSNLQFANYMFRGCSRIYNGVQNSCDRKEMLSFLSFLKSLTMLTLVLTSANEDKNTVCKKVHVWLILLRRIKFYIVAGLHKLDQNPDIHVANSARIAFNYIIALVPCPYIYLDVDHCCLKFCQKFSQHLVQFKSPASNAILSSNLVKKSLSDLDQEISNVKKGVQMECKTAKLFTESSHHHFKNYNKHILLNLKSYWKSWVDLALSNETNDSFKFPVLNLWRTLVDVKSNMTLQQAREFLSSVKCLVNVLPREKNVIIKRKWLEILGEVLCYGSTLGIQSDVPTEASEIAHRLIRQSKTEDGFEAFVLPQVYLGLAGDRVVPTEDNEDLEQVPDLITLQGLTLIHLKSLALLVREAQCCSSSDESDSSLSSRGSSSIAEEEQEMKMIEKTVVELLNKMKSWINDTLGLPGSTSLSANIITIFNEQDDGLIEALLCLLDTYSGLQSGSYAARVTTANSGLNSDDSNSNTCDDSMDFFHPLDGFEGFLQSIANDPSVILDFLLSNETCFLLYFLRILKYLNKSMISGKFPSDPTLQTLQKVKHSIKKLTDKSLFPYDINPVLRHLEKLDGTNSETQ